MSINGVGTNIVYVLLRRARIVGFATHQGYPLVSLSRSCENIDVDLVDNCNVPTIVEMV